MKEQINDQLCENRQMSQSIWFVWFQAKTKSKMCECVIWYRSEQHRTASMHNRKTFKTFFEFSKFSYKLYMYTGKTPRNEFSCSPCASLFTFL